jgi:hypothetical protein
MLLERSCEFWIVLLRLDTVKRPDQKTRTVSDAGEQFE